MMLQLPATNLSVAISVAQAYRQTNRPSKPIHINIKFKLGKGQNIRQDYKLLSAEYHDELDSQDSLASACREKYL